MRKTIENFETKFREKILGGIYSNSKDEQETDLQSWMNELEKVAQEEERRLEAFERKGWAEKTFSLVTAKPGTGSSRPVTGEIHRLFDANGLDDRAKGNDKGKGEGEVKGQEKVKNVKGSWEDEDNVEAPGGRRNREETGVGSLHVFWCVCTRDVPVISGGAMWMSM